MFRMLVGTLVSSVSKARCRYFDHSWRPISRDIVALECNRCHKKIGKY